MTVVTLVSYLDLAVAAVSWFWVERLRVLERVHLDVEGRSFNSLLAAELSAERIKC